MTYDMKLIDYPAQVDSIELAGALLRAWVRGDRSSFRAELDRSSRMAPDHQDTGEGERLQMLNAIADRLKECDDPFASAHDDPGIGVCASLLSHLAYPAAAKPLSRSAGLPVRSVRRSETLGCDRSIPVHLGTSTLH